jgi:hypothetical protein
VPSLPVGERWANSPQGVNLATGEAPTAAGAGPALYRLRTWLPSADEAFVRDSWRRAFSVEEHRRFPDLREYVRVENDVMSHCLRRSRVVVACAPDDEDQILGWVAYRRMVDAREREFALVHYAYVKACFAAPEFGVGDALWDTATREAHRVFASHDCALFAGRPYMLSPYMVFA